MTVHMIFGFKTRKFESIQWCHTILELLFWTTDLDEATVLVNSLRDSHGCRGIELSTKLYRVIESNLHMAVYLILSNDLDKSSTRVKIKSRVETS